MIAIAQQNISGERALGIAAADEQFAALVSRQSRFVFRVAHSVLRNVADAEDATQETFLRVYRKGGWNAIADERAFLARVAWRIAVNRVPKRVHEDVTENLVAAGCSPEQSAITRDWQRVVQRLIDALPDELRWPMVLSSADELTSQDIGQLLEIPEGTVRTRLARARQILKQKLSVLMEKSHGPR